MALTSTNPFSQVEKLPAKRVEPVTVQPRQFASGTGTIKALTPVQDNGSGAFVLSADAAASANTGIQGLVWPDDVTLVSGSEVIGNVLLQGKVHYDDIELPASGLTRANMLLLAKDLATRKTGIIVQGIANAE